MDSAECPVGHDHYVVPRPMFPDDYVDEVRNRDGASRRHSPTRQVIDQTRNRQPLVGRQRRSEHRGNQYLVGADEGPSELLLEDAATGRS